MSSCTNTRRNLLPLCTSNVCPTNSGIMVHARAQVLMGCLARFSLSFETLRNSFSSTYGPFFALLLINHSTMLTVSAERSFSKVHGLRALLMRAELAATQ